LAFYIRWLVPHPAPRTNLPCWWLRQGAASPVPRPAHDRGAFRGFRYSTCRCNGRVWTSGHSKSAAGWG